MSRTLRLRERLETRFAPSELDVIDESHKHAGHSGAADGRGHFKVRIVAQAFAGLTPIARHRLVYEALDDLLKTDIHALTIVAQGP